MNIWNKLKNMKESNKRKRKSKVARNDWQWSSRRYSKRSNCYKWIKKAITRRKNQLERQRKEQEEKANKEKEYDDFIKEFPNVKAEDIPKEVFENSNAKNQTLLQSYKDYLYENIKKELEQYKKNEENSNKVVGSTQGYGSKDSQVATDLFLEGFDS